MQNQPQPVTLVGTSAAIATAIAAGHSIQAASQQAALAAVHASAIYRNAALLELAARFLGELPDAGIAALAITTTARRVLISASQQRHAIARRQVATQFDADLVATRLTEALANLRFSREPQRDPRVFELVGYALSITHNSLRDSTPRS